MEFNIPGNKDEIIPRLLQLYNRVATDPVGIIRRKEEITEIYIADFVNKSAKNGLIIIAEEDGKILGEIHAYTPDIYAFRHILTDLTIVIDPDFQGKGLGKKLFSNFLETVKNKHTHILRVELYVREHNKKNVAFYEQLGFIVEGRHENKIFISPSEFHTPLQMTWFNPNYK